MRRGVRHAGLARPFRRDERAVSPVIGVIMILAISVTGIAATVAWGLPAIDEMKSAVEARAVANQFKELDQDVKQLVSGTAEKTAKRWQPSLGRGSIVVQSATERWVVGYASCEGGGTVECNDQDAGGILQEYSFHFAGFGDTDATFTITNNGTASKTIKVEGATVNNGVESALRVSTDPASNAQMGGEVLAAGATETYYVWVESATATPQDLDTSSSSLEGVAFRFRLIDTVNANKVAAQVWVFDAGEVGYELDSVGTRKTVALTNGAVLVGTGGHETVDNTPGIPATKETPEGHAFFMRGIGFQGRTSFAGEDRFDVLLSLYGTNSLANVERTSEIYLQVGGEHTSAWSSWFSRTNGYTLFEQPAPGTGMIGWTQQVKDGTDWEAIRFTFVHSVVRVDA